MSEQRVVQIAESCVDPAFEALRSEIKILRDRIDRLMLLTREQCQAERR